MKKILFTLIVALALISCKMSTEENTTEAAAIPAATVPADNVRIRNSAWQIVKSEHLTANRAGISFDITSTDALAEEVAAYNEANTDDQWFLEEGEEVPIEESPEAIAFIVNSATLEIYAQYTVARTDLVERRDAWRSSVETMADPDTGKLVPCTLYVDNVPPEPPVIVPPAPRLWTALLDMTAEKVYFSEHFDTQDEANHQYSLDMVTADSGNAGLLDIGNPGDVWQAYIGETEYSF
jgi:hypothetical protein